MRLARLDRFTVHPFRSRGIAAAFLTAALVAANIGGIDAAAHPPAPAADPAVITDWNETAVATIVTDAGKANAEAFLWYAFEQAAVYNAVVGITRDYELYRWNRHGPRWASPEAAAAAAAHRLLLTYFPASQARLDTDLAESLAKIPDGPAKWLGIWYGKRAADRIIELRVDDGRFAALTFDEPLEAGVWRPTPPGFAPFFDPWLSQVRPLLVESPSQFRPAGPPALTSDTYTEEFEEVRDYGVATDSLRTPEQTETALFFSDIGVGPLQASLRDLVTRRHMDISDSARLFAAVDMSLADAIIVSWDSKFHFGFWRPVTAIQLADEDTNPETDADADWLPLVVTPPYPDYTSGLTAVIGALSRTLSGLLGDGRVDLYITSAAAGLPGDPITRYYEFATDLNRDVIDARVWSGIHFRTADVVGNAQGTQVGDWALDHFFQPKHDGDDDGDDDGHVHGHSIVKWQRRFIDWLTTSSENILFNGGCGEVVRRVYFMPVATQPGQEVECDVPKRVRVLASPSGTFSEIPTWGSNDAEVQADLDATWALLLSSAVKVDGVSLSLEGVGRTAGVYNVGPVEEGSFFDLVCEGIPAPCKVDFAPGDTVRLASAAEIVMLRPFSRGTHTVYLAAQFSFVPTEYSLTATLHVG